MCPECGSSIIWSLNSSNTNSESKTKCANNISVSKVDWIPELAKICTWTGIARRQEDGDIKFFYDDGVRLLRPVLKSSDES